MGKLVSWNLEHKYDSPALCFLNLFFKVVLLDNFIHLQPSGFVGLSSLSSLALCDTQYTGLDTKLAYRFGTTVIGPSGYIYLS